MSKEKKVPLPLKEIFKRMNLSTDLKDLGQRLTAVNFESHIIQDYVRLSDSLEWDLSQLHWDNEGLLPFVENNVPFIINNSGRLSAQTALVLFSYCEEVKSRSEITLLELGSGTGLFARYLLDSFKEICQQEGRDYYHKMRYFITDYSKTTIAQWQEWNIFAKHEDRVVLATCNGINPSEVVTANGKVIRLESIDAVFCNYVLDILPFTVFRKKIKALIASNNSDERKKLIPLIDVLEHEISYEVVDEKSIPYLQILNDMEFSQGRVLLNHGALTCLRQCSELLKHHGFILINDYGPTNKDEMESFGLAQRFGSTVANGLNFPLLKTYFKNSGYRFLAPEGYEGAPLQSRILIKGNLQSISESFLDKFSSQARDYYESSLVEAREHQAAGRRKEALEAYHIALTRNQKDWYVVCEIAEYVILQIQDFKSGVEIAQHAVSLNPWYSTWVWNVLGDGLYCMGQYNEAHEAYLQAERIDAKDPRTNLNLAYTYYQRGNYEKALDAVSKGLAHDMRSQYRERLLEKQQQTLTAISGKWLSKQEQLMNRTVRLS